MKNCPVCGAPVADDVPECFKCGSDLSSKSKSTPSLMARFKQEADLQIVEELDEDELVQGLGDVPTYSMTGPELGLVDLLVNASVYSGKRQAREGIGNGAIYINGERRTDTDRIMRKADGLHGKYIVIRRGKRNYFLVS